MDPSRFGPQSPGTLVPASVVERRAGGIAVPVAGLAFLVRPLPPPLEWERLIGRLWPALQDVERAVARLERDAAGFGNPHLLLSPIWRREARLSSQIEDTIATPEEIALEQSGLRADRDDPREVANYIVALEHGVRSELPLCARLLKEMHAKLMASADPRMRVGEYRAVQAYIGSAGLGFARARFVPAPPGPPLEDAMRDLERFINGQHDGPRLPDLVSIALAHYQFEAIHPFHDGNGRLGRLLIGLSLVRAGVLSHPWMYVSEYFASHRQAYYDRLLAVSERGEWDEWIGFVLHALHEQAISTRARIGLLMEVRSRLIALVQQPRDSVLLRNLIEALFDHPILTISRVEQLCGVSRKGARNLVEKLIDRGIIEPYDAPGREHRFICRDVMQATDEG